MEISMEVPQKTKNRITIWSDYTTPGYIYLQESMSADNRDIYKIYVYCSTIHNNQLMELA
jgi:hypothetical protein